MSSAADEDFLSVGWQLPQDRRRIWFLHFRAATATRILPAGAGQSDHLDLAAASGVRALISPTDNH